MIFLALFSSFATFATPAIVDALFYGAMYPLAAAMVVAITMLAAATAALIMDYQRGTPVFRLPHQHTA